MNETDLPQRLERAASTIEVSAAPLDAVMTRGRRRRRRRAAAQSALGMGTVAAVVWVGTVLAPGPAEPQPPTTVAVSPTEAGQVPRERLHGRGHVAFVRPEGWTVNDVECSQPASDTVIEYPRVDHFATAPNLNDTGCMTARPDVDSVSIVATDLGDGAGLNRPTSLDGVPVHLTPVTCVGGQRSMLCTQTLHVPQYDVSFVAESRDRDALARILANVRVVKDVVGVLDEPTADLEEMLAGVGADLRVVKRWSRYDPPGTVFGITPSPGTFVGAGDVVTVTVAPDRGPEDAPWITFRSIGGPSPIELTDWEVRTHTRIASRVGHTIELTSEGGTLDGVTARLEGTSVVPADDSEHPSTFLVEHRGTTVMTIYTVEDGVETEIGEVIVYAP